MEIDGKLIAQQILNWLKQEIQKLALRPTLAVILVGEDPASASYIKQKQKAAEFIGARLVIEKLGSRVIKKKIIKLIGELNKDSEVHGIIVQLPLPTHLSPNQIISHVTAEKDVDGFTPNSPFTPPVAMAVLKVLNELTHLRGEKSASWRAGVPASGRGDTSKVKVKELAAERWQNANFLVIGRGLTAGKPIAKTLKELRYKVSVAHSQTTPDQLAKMVKSADVVISCVGKPNIFRTKDLKPGAIVIGVGIHRETVHLRGNDSPRMVAVRQLADMTPPRWTLAGDFNEEEVSKVASFYTPTPGGIGPINVACLMENLVKATQNQVQQGV